MRLLIFYSILVSNISISFAQIQLGDPILGEAAQDQAGYTLALSGDGTRMAVGARLNDNAAQDAGHVRVFEWNGESWEQLGEHIQGIAPGDRASWSLDLSDDGNYIAVGTRTHDSNGISDAGHVRIFNWNGTSWVQIGDELTGEAFGDLFGIAVSISANGHRLAVSKIPGTSPYPVSYVYIYEWNGSGWVQLGNVIIGDPSEGYRHFGYSLSIDASGSRLAIGTRFFSDGAMGIDLGAGQVFEFDGEEWVQIGQNLIGTDEDDQFGFSISISADGQRLAIGAPNNSDAFSLGGHVRVYQWMNDEWQLMDAPITGQSFAEYSGSAISLSGNGDRIAIGVPYKAFPFNNSIGEVRIFEWTGDEWLQFGNPINGDATNDQFGKAVALSNDGQTVIAGAPFHDSPGQSAGQVKAFQLLLVNTQELDEVKEIQVSPNPTSGLVNFLEPIEGTILVYNQIGELVSTTSGNTISSLNLSMFPSGTYYLKISQGGQLYAITEIIIVN